MQQWGWRSNDFGAYLIFLLLLFSFFFSKFLDPITGTFRYYHSPTNTVHMYPPEMAPSSAPPSTPPTHKVKPQPPAERDREPSKLKRSYSSPDITQALQEEEKRRPAVTPAVNRENK